MLGSLNENFDLTENLQNTIKIRRIARTRITFY